MPGKDVTVEDLLLGLEEVEGLGKFIRHNLRKALKEDSNPEVLKRKVRLEEQSVAYGPLRKYFRRC